METPFTNEATAPEEQESYELRPADYEEQELRDVVEEIVDYYICNYYPSRFDIIKAKYLFNGDEKRAVWDTFSDSKSNLTCHRHGLIDSTHDAFTKEVLSQNYTPKMIPLHPCKREFTDDAQDAYDWMYHRSRFETEVSEQAYSEAVLIWDSYAFFGKKKYGWFEVPTSEHISFFEMFLEPMATSFEHSRYKIVRKVLDSIDVIKKYEWITDWNKETFIEWLPNSEAILETIDAALYDSDFSKIWDINTWEQKYQEACDNYCNWVDGWSREQKFQEWFSTGRCYEDLFWLSEDSSLCEVIEFWEKKSEWYQVRVMVNGYLLPTDEITLEYDPFGNIFYEESIGSPVHRWLWHKLMPRQREADMLLFIIDNWIKMHAFPDWITESGLLDADNNIIKNLFWSAEGIVMTPKKSNMAWKQPFRAVEYMAKDILNLSRVRLGEVETSAYRDAGINSYIMWWDGRVERVRAAHDDRMNQSRARLKTIKKSISTALNKSYYVWLDILDWKFGKKLLERLDDDNKPHMVDLNIKEIVNNFEVLISSEGQREESLKDLWQNILNTVNGMWELLSDEFGTIFDRKALACSLAESYGLDGLKFLTPEQRLSERKEQLSYGLEVAKLEKEIAKEAQEMQWPEWQQQQEGLFDPRTWEPLDPALVWAILDFLESQGGQQQQPAAQEQEIFTDEQWALFNG